MSRSQPSNSKAPDPASDPFFQDLEAAINNLVDAAAFSHLHDESKWVTLARHPDLGEYVCWCGDEKEHSFQTCYQRLALGCKAPPTVSPDAGLSHCPHLYNKVTFDHNCFCFQIAGTMKLFHQFFLRPRISAILSPEHNFHKGDRVEELDSVQEEALWKIVNIYNRRVEKSQQWASASAKCKALARFVTDMRREDIVSEANKESRLPWHIERVHAILRWRKRGVDDCVAELKTAMEKASRHRISPHKSLAECIFDGEISFDR